jgi:hypothetical protein
MKFINSGLLCTSLCSITLLACGKSEIKISEEPPEIKKEEYQLQFRSDYWQVYPYIGGPGEDSVYFINSPSIENITLNVVSVEIKQADTVSKCTKNKRCFSR